MSEQYDRVCKNDFAKIHAALDRLDTAIRGNGRPGIQLRLSRLEAAEATRSRLLFYAESRIMRSNWIFPCNDRGMRVN